YSLQQHLVSVDSSYCQFFLYFYFAASTTDIYTLSLHDALPILAELSKLAPGFNWQAFLTAAGLGNINELVVRQPTYFTAFAKLQDRKSTRLNSSHVKISYAVFCL